MRRGEKPTKAQANPKRPVARQPAKGSASRVRELEQRLAAAREQQAATGEILRVIASEPAHAQTVLAMIAERAMRLCGAQYGGVVTFDGALIHLGAHVFVSPEFSDSVRRLYPRPPGPGIAATRAVLTRAIVHLPDLERDPEYELKEAARAAGFRSALAVPMLRDGQALGAIVVFGGEAAPFSDGQITQLQTFADQAVIAIENARLVQELEGRNRELTETLDQQTATSEILRVISSSPTDVQPVFDAMAESAARLCEVPDVSIFRREGEGLHLVAHHGPIPVQSALPLVRGTSNGRAVLDGQTIHVADMQAEADEFPEGSANARLMGHRAILCVPLVRDGVAVGTILLRRTEARRFTDRQVALLQTFADQAVIAIENVRLFTETKEALEQQTATAEILSVISSSPTDVQPVFDAIVRSALRLLDGVGANVARVVGDELHRAAFTMTGEMGDRALSATYPMPISGWNVAARAVRAHAPVYLVDTEADPDYQTMGKGLTRARGVRSIVAVPMISQTSIAGTIAVSRREPGSFSDKEIALLQTFADQAVIAIENARVFSELQEKNRALTVAHGQVTEALEQQTATAEILKVISSSPTDTRPVFDAIAANAARLCGANDAQVLRVDGDVLRLVAAFGTPSMPSVRRLTRGHLVGRAVIDRQTIHVRDLAQAVAEYSETTAARFGVQSALAVPLLRDGTALGVIRISRTEVQPFTDKQIALLQTFADQAVIAIENTRLFAELQEKNGALTQAHAQVSEALDRQTATAEILKVISSSPRDVQPVFDSLVSSAARLCGANDVLLLVREGEVLRPGAGVGSFWQSLAAGFRVPLVRSSIAARSVIDGATLHVPDLAALPEGDFSAARDLQRQFGHHTVLAVPLLRDEVALGVIFAMRFEVRPFADQQIALMKTFADQAVIAIENVRLFQELGARNVDLTEALARQTATSEVLRAISGSPTDAQPVFETIVRSAVRLCEGLYGMAHRFDGELLHLTAHHNCTPEVVRALEEAFPRRLDRQMMSGRAILTGAVVHVEDVLADPEYEQHLGRVAGFRAALAVPMLREGSSIGAIVVLRGQPGPFSETQIGLLKTFADQAVIAIENVRLFRELEARNRDLTESLEQQTATGDILKVISSSPTDVQPVFETIAERAVRLCAANLGIVVTFDGELLHLAALANFGAEPADGMRRAFPHPPGQGSAVGRAVLTKAVVHVPSMLEDPEYALRDLAQVAGVRSVIGVPMLKAESVIGAIAVARLVAGRFSEREIALLQTFADQAVIAIENVRLFNELQARNQELTSALDRQTATAEILRAISQAQADAQPVFDAIVSNAVRLLRAGAGTVTRIAGDSIELAAMVGTDDAADQLTREAFPRSVHSQGLHGHVARTGAPLNVVDYPSDPRWPEGARERARRRGYRSWIVLPMLLRGEALGTVAVTRREPGGFTVDEIALLQTFANQAVIAIENTRLLGELQAHTAALTRSVGELQALGEVSRAVGSSLELATVLATIVSRAVQLSGGDQGVVFEFEEGSERFHMRASHRIGPELLETLRAVPIRLGEGAIGEAGASRRPVEITDIEDERQLVAPQTRRILLREGMRSLLAVPLVREDRLLGALAVGRRQAGAFSPEIVAILQSFATQSVLAIHNARLFREIQHQKQYADALVETSPVAIVTTDLRFGVVGWNPGAERLFGYTQAEALGRLLEDLVATPDTLEEVRGNIARSLHGERISAITRRVRKDGTLVDVETSAMPVVVEGVQVGLLVIYHDITELLRARREAEAANEAKSAFLATMSHEIRTPMNAVIGMSGLLLNTALTDDQREYAEVIRHSGDTLLTVINDILDFSKIEAGKLELESQPFDLRECVESALDLVATRAAEKGLDLAYLIAEGTPPAIVGDVTRLRQVLLNLLSNAVKFTERGEVVLAVNAVRLDGPAAVHEATFAVRDTGIGIPPERLGRLFQSFSQVDASTTRRFGGSGLGLAISRRLTELMGGQIDVTSEVGVGSEFRFTIRAPAAEVSVVARRDLSGVQPSLSGKRVLVVDDNATNRRILTAHLDTWGLGARATGSPAEALEWIRAGALFDIGILDMHMPEMDGVTLAQAIREHRSSAELPLVLFSSLGRRETRAGEADFAAYLHKPIKPSQLFDALVSVLAERPVHMRDRGVARTEIDPDMARRHPLRILLAEDNIVNQKVALRLLGQMGYRADVAANGLEAIEAVERQAYDVVLMDVQMPELDGFEASREITRRWPGAHRPRIVAMTANAMQGDRELCEAAGMDDYVAKPIRVEELITALERCPWRSEAGPRSGSAPSGAPAEAPSGPSPAHAGSPGDLRGETRASPGARGTPGAEAIDRAVFDRLAATMGREFAAELIDTFVADGRELLAALRRALAETDVDAFRRAAHSLKSNSESLGATSLATLARALEATARAGSVSGVGDRLGPLSGEYERAAASLRELQRDLSP